jgi:RNA-directed DNA polymerase
LDADIEGCFDNINHQALLEKLDTIPVIRNQINSWLKAGIMQSFDAIKTMETVHEHNERGTPQGGVISPLLCNIALHGLESEVVGAFPRHAVKLVRYADDFLVFSAVFEDINEAKTIIEDFLDTVGLKLSKTKTRIVHSMEKHETETPGFDFLGFHFRNVKCSIHRGVKSTRGKKQTFIQKSMPSLAAIKTHKGNLKAILKKYKKAPLPVVFERLNATIQGWTRYHNITKCTRTFSYLDS